MATHAYPELTVPAASARRATFFMFATAALSLVGLADALYLTALHLSGATARCTVLTGCSEVLGSPYATVGGGVPLALLGACAYFSVFSLSILVAFGYRFAVTPLVALVWLMCGVSLLLVGVQAFVIRAFCEFCLLSACVTFLLTVLIAVGKIPSLRRM